MAENRPSTSRRKSTSASYTHEWNRFVAWSEPSGGRSLPATPEEVAAYQEYRAQAGARASTIKVAPATIAHNHKEAGFVPLRPGVARVVLDAAMNDLMRYARLQVSEATVLPWGDLEMVPGGSGRVRVGDTGHRVVSTDTMRLLSSVRKGPGDDEPLLGMRPNQIAIRIGTAARQAGLGEGYSGESPRLGMIQDMETLGVLLLGSYRYA